jgi:hypothetical protein
MFILGRAHQSHPAKHVLGWAVGGGWPLSQAQHWVANKTSAQPGSPSAGRQTPEGGRPWPGLTRPDPVRLARPAAATLTNTPQMNQWCDPVVGRAGMIRYVSLASTIAHLISDLIISRDRRFVFELRACRFHKWTHGHAGMIPNDYDKLHSIPNY